MELVVEGDRDSSHDHACRCVGVSVAAFARAVLEGSTQPGVWFPEEVGSDLV